MKSNTTQKLAEWKKVLKDDEDFDYHYILRILRYKLARTRASILGNNIIADAKKVGAEIQEVIVLLDRVMKDRYDDKELRPLVAKYGPRRLRMNFKPIPGKTMSECTVSSAWDKLPAAQKKSAYSQLKKAYKTADRKRRNDLQKAFSRIQKNIWGWWD